MPKTMKAAFVTEFGKPLTLGELPVPEPGDGQLLIKYRGVRCLPH